MFETKEYLEDEIILAEGELGKGFCILEDGIVEVIRNDLILNEINQKGAIFGELSEILMYKRGARKPYRLLQVAGKSRFGICGRVRTIPCTNNQTEWFATWIDRGKSIVPC